ncbi:cytochrome d ubiquinol oxidase subunit II [Demequina aurantiaca]|uniref:cytochrome d ubiquinol oxidase subunit II n=1 Tax=Demequina aurantiaca TaxID=676200 RepID=UPI003D33A960
MELTTVWFLVIAFLWTGYLVLEGFDFGVAMLMPVVGKNNAERRVALNTIGPVWDGNEVWLLAAGGCTFAAFPQWYASMFSGFYLPLLFILLALILRAVAIEYRAKINDPRWRTNWDRAIIVTAWVPSILWGVAFANLVRGVPLDSDHEFIGNFFTFLSPFALLGGAVTLLLFLTHGSVFLALKTDGIVRERAQKLAVRFAPVALVVTAVWAIWAQLAYSDVAWTWIPIVAAAVGLVLVWRFSLQGHNGKAFTANAVAIVGAAALIFGSMFPDVMPASNDAANSLTVYNASSTSYALTVMTWFAVFMLPVVLLYQSWSYWVFHKRIHSDHIPEHNELTFAKD